MDCLLIVLDSIRGMISYECKRETASEVKALAGALSVSRIADVRDALLSALPGGGAQLEPE